jgi:RNA polymerase sigma factor (sigma-70 family)
LRIGYRLPDDNFHLEALLMPLLDPSSTIDHWLERFRDGDPSARNELLHHSRERLRLLTHQMFRKFARVHRFEETSDVLQYALIRLDRALGAVDVTSSRDFFRLSAFHIRRVLLGLARHYYGPEGIGTHEEPVGSCYEELVHQRRSQEDDPYQFALWTELHEVMGNLPPEEQELFDLLYYLGLTRRQAASLLGVPYGTLKRRWLAVRARFVELIRELPR